MINSVSRHRHLVYLLAVKHFVAFIKKLTQSIPKSRTTDIDKLLLAIPIDVRIILSLHALGKIVC